ncbi:copper homeostasis protein CutC [Flavobacterium sp. GT3R68]|uniref:copper homeostasis protein CutC n=1 Tax=Flavobacterium sp. GT3R68 TaxID=2594437 RepID=UPI000F89119A|nr:copper homeostasis protein CutC [Flavobacterium sp. GT3R68]RTY92477.1 copper homeostasis protein CutC [Flavobacterium sp. GSN2]TRW94103.1 copper homeostasis protein CutC [Flavobacterium sp. GT3R68]
MIENQLEIACFNPESAIIAQQNGADRVELCANIHEGGTTPDLEITHSVRAAVTIDLYVMIRPRGGDFVYSDAEFEQMKSGIAQFKTLNVDGFVFGILNEDGTVNKKQNTELVRAAHPNPCTFHRAFDVAKAVFQSLEDVIDCGFKTILTSGQGENVVEGIPVLSQLVNLAKGRIVIMPGGGLRSFNIGMLQFETQAAFYHSSAITDNTGISSGDEVRLLKVNLQQ